MGENKSLIERVIYYLLHKDEIDKIIEGQRVNDTGKSLIERATYAVLHEKDIDEEHRKGK